MTAAPGTFLATASLICSLYVQLLDILPKTALSFYNAAVKAHETWEGYVPEDCVIPLTAIDSPCLFHQEQLVNPAKVAVFDSLDKVEDRKKGFRASLAVSSSKDWLYCQSAPGPGTYIVDRNYKAWIHYY